MSDEEISKFLELSKNRLINSNYNVYFTGDKYIYDEQETIVKDNELMIAIKQNKWGKKWVKQEIKKI